MKAARYQGPGCIAVENIPAPVCGDGELLLEMKACGICGTDVKTYVRGHPLISPGNVLGHELAGVVAESRHPEFKSGDRVVAAPYAPCLACGMCRRHLFSLCENLFEASLEPGGFAEFVRVPKRVVDQAVVKLPDHLDYMTASLTEPLACCFHGLEALDVQAGQSLLVMGDGPMGLLQAALGTALHASPVYLVGLTPHRLGLAQRFADVVIDVSKQDLFDTLKKHAPGGPEKIIVSVGSTQVVQEALQLVAKGGAVNIFAGMPKDATLTLPMNRIHYDEIGVMGTFGFGPQHFRRATDFLSPHGAALAAVFTHTVPLDNVEAALQAASRYEGVKGAVIR